MRTEEMKKRNYIVLMLRRTIAGFFNSLPTQYVNVYILEMGFSEQELGLLRSIARLIASLPSSLLCFWADVSDRRKSYLIGLGIEILSALILFLGVGQLAMVIALLLSLTSFFGLRYVENILIADSISSRKRAFGFGILDSLTIFASLFSPIVAAYIVNLFGGISVEGIRPLFLIQFAGLLFASIIAGVFVRDIRMFAHFSLRKTFYDSLTILRLNPWLRRWIVLEVLGGYVFSLSMPYEMIYAIKVKGADEFVLGYMGFALNVGSIIALPIIGWLADRIGRVKTIVILRPLFYLSVCLFLLSSSPIHLITAWFIRGIWFASRAPFQTLALELVPYDYRGRWNGIKTLIAFTLGSPGSLIGGYLYMLISPETPFIVALLVDLLLRLPLIYMTPETLDRKAYLEEFRRTSW